MRKMNLNTKPVENKYQRAFYGKNGEMDISKFQDFIRNQKRCQGNQFAATTSAQTIPIQLGGNQSFLFGIALSNTAPGDVFSLIVNEEKVITNADATIFDPSFRFIGDEFFQYPRPLNKSDQISVVYTAVGNQTVSIQLYFV